METKKYITIQDLPKLEKLYKKAIKEKKDIFIFKDSNLLVNYAKYVIEHLKSLN